MTNRRIKKASGFISLIMVCTITLGLIGSVNFKTIAAENDKTAFSSQITATQNAHGQVVNILPEEVRLWNESEMFDVEYLKGLYEYSNLRKEYFNGASVDFDRSCEIYRQTDAFNPVNNVLKWQSSLKNVESYKVRVAYDNKFTQCVQIEKHADINSGVILENPLTGKTYYWQVIATIKGGEKVYSPIFDFTVENSLRTITVDGVSNTRDIGGYQTVYGYVQEGLVYRSARLEAITKKGLDTFKNKLGVKTDLDLRGKAEANLPGNKEDPAKCGKDYYVFPNSTPNYVGTTSGIDYEDNFDTVKSVMSVFTDKNNYPIDFHCAIGCDRTGTIAALLKSLLGYAEQDIVNDYFTSAFATTGSWDKSSIYIVQYGIFNILDYLNTFEGETLADRTADYLITKCGMTGADIATIRNIMTGQEGYEVKLPKLTADEDNYSELSFVKFEKFGAETVVKAVANGETVDEINAGEGYVWTLDGQAYDFNAEVSEDITLKAVKATTYEVKVVSTGAIDTQETIITVAEGAAFDFADLQKDGYEFIIISDTGEVVTELTVSRKTTLNVVYVQI